MAKGAEGSRKKNLPIIAGVAAAVIGVLLMNQQMSGRKDDLEKQYTRDMIGVAVAEKNMEAGAILSPDQVDRTKMAADPLPWSIIKLEDPDASVEARRLHEDRMAQLSGRVLNRNIKKGELILWTDFQSPQNDSLSDLLTGAQRGVAVEVDRAATMGGLLQPNDRVDVLATYEAGPTISGEASRQIAKTVVVLKDVSILAVGNKMARGTTDTRGGQTTIILGVEPDQALALSHVQKQAKISLLLRPRKTEASTDYSKGEVSSGELRNTLEVLKIAPGVQTK